jgi:hypothetical protein
MTYTVIVNYNSELIRSFVLLDASRGVAARMIFNQENET